MIIQSPAAATATINYITSAYRHGAYTELFELDLTRPTVDALAQLPKAACSSLSGQASVFRSAISVSVSVEQLDRLLSADRPLTSPPLQRRARLNGEIAKSIAVTPPSDMLVDHPAWRLLRARAADPNYCPTAEPCIELCLDDSALFDSIHTVIDADAVMADEQRLIASGAPYLLCRLLCDTTQYRWRQLRRSLVAEPVQGRPQRLRDDELVRLRSAYVAVTTREALPKMTAADCLAIVKLARLSLRDAAPSLLRWMS